MKKRSSNTLTARTSHQSNVHGQKSAKTSNAFTLLAVSANRTGLSSCTTINKDNGSRPHTHTPNDPYVHHMWYCIIREKEYLQHPAATEMLPNPRLLRPRIDSHGGHHTLSCLTPLVRVPTGDCAADTRHYLPDTQSLVGATHLSRIAVVG